jgi:hypothetical protein
MNPAQIAIQNMYLVLKVASALFVFRIGLTLFGKGNYAMYLDLFALAALATMVISSLTGFMGAAESISNGVWPK